MDYQHTQIGYLIIGVLVFILTTFVLIFIYMDDIMHLVPIMSIIILVLFMFVSLNITLDNNYLRLKFGIGLIQKKFLLKDIISVEKTKSKLYYGWGIKYFWPYTWIYSVSGFDAVQLEVSDGNTYIIGTDEPEKLERTLLLKINKN